MVYYLRATRSADDRGDDVMTWLRNPWGKPRFLVLVTAVYILWSLIPVAIAVLFAFNDGRSRTTWQGFSTRWFTGADRQRLPRPGAPGRARAHAVPRRRLRARRDAARRRARARAAALARARRRHRQHADAAAARHARDRDGRRAAAALPAGASRASASARRPRSIGQVTFTISYVVVIVRGRLVSIGKDYEEAAADLGAPPRDQLAPRAPAAARPGDHRERRGRLRDLDRRLRRHAVPLRRREHDDGVDAALRVEARGADPGAQRARHDRARDHAGDARARLPRLPAFAGGDDAAAIVGVEV